MEKGLKIMFFTNNPFSGARIVYFYRYNIVDKMFYYYYWINVDNEAASIEPRYLTVTGVTYLLIRDSYNVVNELFQFETSYKRI